jgi:hypothetical protein
MRGNFFGLGNKGLRQWLTLFLHSTKGLTNVNYVTSCDRSSGLEQFIIIIVIIIKGLKTSPADVQLI